MQSLIRGVSWRRFFAGRYVQSFMAKWWKDESSCLILVSESPMMNRMKKTRLHTDSSSASSDMNPSKANSSSDRYIRASIRAVSFALSERSLALTFADHETTTLFDYIWLRDNCICPRCFNLVTKQRRFSSSMLSPHVKPESAELDTDGKVLSVSWIEGDSNQSHQSEYSTRFLFDNSYNPPMRERSDFETLEPYLWDVEHLIKDFPCRSFDNKQFGILFVARVPLTMEGTTALANRIGMIRTTHFGTVWDVEANMRHKDTAYGNNFLAPHTDGTYLTEPPGLQMFHFIERTGTGGDSLFIDGFHAAALLQLYHPESYKILSRTRVQGYFSEQSLRPLYPMPILIHHPVTKKLLQVRYNAYDRLPVTTLKSSEDIQTFYAALRDWENIISPKRRSASSSPETAPVADSENEREDFWKVSQDGTGSETDASVSSSSVPSLPRLVYTRRLEPGMAVIFDNTRVLHGRYSFTGHRRFLGCYLNYDDLNARLRQLFQSTSQAHRVSTEEEQ